MGQPVLQIGVGTTMWGNFIVNWCSIYIVRQLLQNMGMHKPKVNQRVYQKNALQKR